MIGYAAAIEYAAALASLVCVWLTVKQHVWCWPFGILGTILYTWVFFQSKLYSDTGLQVVFTILQLYGWWLWVRGGRGAAANEATAGLGSEAETVGGIGTSPDASKGLRVTRLHGPAIRQWMIVILVGTVLLGHQMKLRTDAALPYVDAFQTVMSLAAQYLMGFKILESWVLWILVDIISVGMYYTKQLYVTMGLYAVFLWMAAMGWHAWYRETIPAEPPTEVKGREAEATGPRTDANELECSEAASEQNSTSTTDGYR